MGDLNILYLDDDHDLLEMYSNLIRDWGLEIDTVDNPKEALSILTKGIVQYDILLVDYKMPVMNGIEFLYTISMEDYFRIEKIALFSSLAHNPSVQEEIKLKIPDFQSRIHCIEKVPDRTNELMRFLNLDIGSVIHEKYNLG